jgi:hypothetical protein
MLLGVTIKGIFLAAFVSICHLSALSSVLLWFRLVQSITLHSTGKKIFLRLVRVEVYQAVV